MVSVYELGSGIDRKNYFGKCYVWFLRYGHFVSCVCQCKTTQKVLHFGPSPHSLHTALSLCSSVRQTFGADHGGAAAQGPSDMVEQGTGLPGVSPLVPEQAVVGARQW